MFQRILYIIKAWFNHYRYKWFPETNVVEEVVKNLSYPVLGMEMWLATLGGLGTSMVALRETQLAQEFEREMTRQENMYRIQQLFQEEEFNRKIRDVWER